MSHLLENEEIEKLWRREESPNRNELLTRSSFVRASGATHAPRLPAEAPQHLGAWVAPWDSWAQAPRRVEGGRDRALEGWKVIRVSWVAEGAGVGVLPELPETLMSRGRWTGQWPTARNS